MNIYFHVLSVFIDDCQCSSLFRCLQNGILQISFRKLDIYGFYVAYDGIWNVINDRQSHFG